MEDYNNYVTAVNKIFELINTMKTKWTATDNINYIEKIEESKEKCIEISNFIQSKQSGMEELGND